jgi:cell volume regulation protein A
MLYLIFLGIVVGPIMGLFNPDTIMSLAPFIAALSLDIILFDGGMKMKLHEVFAETPIATLLAIVGFIVETVIVAVFTHYVLGFPWLYGLLFGTIFGGGGDAVAVISLVMRAKISKKCETVLGLESVIDDILCVVGSLVITNILITGQADSSIIFKEIASQFLLGGTIGVIFGLIWLKILRKIEGASYTYMVTIAVVFFSYTTSEYLGGSGALSSFLFGLVLGNESEIVNMLKWRKGNDESNEAGLKRFEDEIAFLIRSFFFVYLGLIASNITLNSLFWGFLITFLLLVSRFGTIKLITRHNALSSEAGKMSIIATRGVVAAILATIPMQNHLLYGNLFLNLTVVVIILSAILCTTGLLSISHFKHPHQQEVAIKKTS